MEDNLNSNLEDMREEFRRYLSLATKNAVYPYHVVLIPKIEVIADFLFQETNFFAFHDVLAAKLLECMFLNPQF